MKDKIIDILSRFWFVLLMLLCCIVLSIKFVWGQNLESDARHLMEVDQTDKAIAVRNPAIQLYPSASALWYHLGMAPVRNDERDHAEKPFDMGISQDTKEVMNYNGRGYLAMLENNTKKAQQNFHQALSMTRSRNTSVWKAVSVAYLVDSKLAGKTLDMVTKQSRWIIHLPQI